MTSSNHGSAPAQPTTSFDLPTVPIRAEVHRLHDAGRHRARGRHGEITVAQLTGRPAGAPFAAVNR